MRTSAPDIHQKESAKAGFGRGCPRVRLRTIVTGLLSVVAVLLLGAAWWLARPPTLESVDLLLLTPESVGKVEAAAKAGDIQAQSSLGLAYLRGSEYVPRNVTKSLYWLHQITDRDRAEHDQIVDRMQSLLERRRHASDPRRQRQLDLQYLRLAEEKLAFELAFVALIQVYSGGQGASYANPALARKYLRHGAAYGFASVQRMLGMRVSVCLGWGADERIAGPETAPRRGSQG